MADSIKKVYKRYKHLDKWVQDSRWNNQASQDLQILMLYDLWEAVKQAVRLNYVADPETTCLRCNVPYVQGRCPYCEREQPSSG